MIIFILLFQKLGKAFKDLSSNTKVHIENQVLFTPIYGVFILDHISSLGKKAYNSNLNVLDICHQLTITGNTRLKKILLEPIQVNTKSISFTILQFRKTVHLFDKLENQKMPTNST